MCAWRMREHSDRFSQPLWLGHVADRWSMCSTGLSRWVQDRASQKLRGLSPSYCQGISDSTNRLPWLGGGETRSLPPRGTTGLGSRAGVAVLGTDHLRDRHFSQFSSLRHNQHSHLQEQAACGDMRGARIIPWSLHNISDIQLLFLSADEGIKARRGPSYFNSPEVH